MTRLEAAYGRLLEAFALVACALVLSMTVMICADVLLRNVRIIPGVAGLAWSNEISEAMLYLVTMLTAPWLLRRGQHIRVDVVLRAVPKRLGWAFEWTTDIECPAEALRHGVAQRQSSAPGRGDGAAVDLRRRVGARRCRRTTRAVGPQCCCQLRACRVARAQEQHLASHRLHACAR